MRFVCSAFAIILLWQVSFGASVHSSITPREAHVGEELLLTIKVGGALGKAIAFPPPPAGGFELLTLDTSLVIKSGVMKYSLAIFDTGTYPIPALPVLVLTGATVETLRTTPHSVRITSALPDTASTILALKSYRLHPFQLRELKKYLWALLALLLGVAGWWIWKRYFKRNRGEEQSPELLFPAHELAIRELILLKDKKYPNRGMLKEFFSEFSEIMRRYIERRYKFPALEMTTYDLEREFEEPRYPADLTRRLVPSLREADLVKFAKYVPQFDLCERHLELGYEIIELTREQPESDSSEAKAA
jgi:HEPN domain-containing protein